MGSVFTALFLFFGTAFGADCDKSIIRIMTPIEAPGKTSLCFDEYFQIRDLAKMSKSDETSKIFEDMYHMVFDDMVVFTYDKPMGKDGRDSAIREIYQTYKQSLHNEYGVCDVSMWDGEKELSVEDFKYADRSEGTIEASRLYIQSEDYKSPRWKLKCPNEKGEKVVKKSGEYFFIFIDIYEDDGTHKSHASQYLFSFRDRTAIY